MLQTLNCWKKILRRDSLSAVDDVILSVVLTLKPGSPVSPLEPLSPLGPVRKKTKKKNYFRLYLKKKLLEKQKLESPTR